MPKGYYIGFGLNWVDPDAYGGWDGELQAAEKDVQLYTDLALHKGFKVLASMLGEKTTRDNVRKALKEAAFFAAPGDTVFIAYSGHGGQFKKGKTLYESYCLYDGQFSEKELRNLVAGFRDGVRVVAVLDCCHSGGFDRDMMRSISTEGLIPKTMPKDVGMFLDALDAKGEHAHIKPLTTKGKLVKWLTACKKKEVAFDGENHGMFTAAVSKLIQKSIADKKPISYLEVMSGASELCTPHQHPLLKNAPKSKKFDDTESIFTI